VANHFTSLSFLWEEGKWLLLLAKKNIENMDRERGTNKMGMGEEDVGEEVGLLP
jgi:hypothetical protein